MEQIHHCRSDLLEKCSRARCVSRPTASNPASVCRHCAPQGSETRGGGGTSDTHQRHTSHWSWTVSDRERSGDSPGAVG
eukprot:1140418-Prymnesium_polylepis.1